MDTASKVLLGATAVSAVAAGIFVLRNRPRRPRSNRCTYTSYQWSVRNRRAENHQTIDKPFNQVAGDEISPYDPDCTVCESDQVEVSIPGVEPFDVCWKYAAQIERALRRAQRDGFVIEEVQGYRPGRTGGSVDSAGRRTEWHHHAFGTAVDINRDYNGLYSGGSRRQGGRYDPEAHPDRTVTPSSPVYRRLRGIGMRWAVDHADELGYEDYMHFDISGRQ